MIHSRIVANSDIPITPFEFYQSPEWASMIKEDIIDTVYIGFFDHTSLVGYVQVFIYSLFGQYRQLFIPRGPVFISTIDSSEYSYIYTAISSVARDYNAIFTLMEPGDLTHLPQWDKYWSPYHSPIQRLPHQTIIIDLSQSKDTIWNQFHSKLRYNIRLAHKKLIRTEFIDNNHPDFELHFNTFYEIVQETSIRSTFGIHTKEHYKHILSFPSKIIHPYLAISYQNDIATTANLMMDYQDMTIYLHGGTRTAYLKSMSAQLTQWNCLQYAQSQGQRYYDLWGISDKKQSWQGITRFKRQFGGTEIQYPESIQIIHKKMLYTLYTALRKIKPFFSR